MAEPMSPEAQALSKQPKAFTLPPVPELSALNANLGGTPGVSDFAAKRPDFKTSAQASAEQEKQLAKLGEVEAPIMAAQQAGEQYKATAQADIARQSREQSQDIESGLDLVREKFPYEQFKPTQENMQSLATLFSVIGMIGVSMGGGGKNSAMGALNAMTGMMSGWQKGRKDLWEKEKAEFDKNMAKTKAILDDAYKDADRAYKALAYNREEAMALAGESVAKLGGQVGKQILEKQGIERYINYLDGVRKDLKHAEDLASKERIDAEREDRRDARLISSQAHSEKMAAQSSANQLDRMLIQFKQQEKLLDKRLEELGKRRTSEDRKNDREAMVMTQGVRSIENLQKQLRDPDVRTGLTSKLEPLLQKIKSLSNTEDFESAINRELTGNDKTTLFLKDALLETYAIERAAKGGQRLTVQDMKMVGPVLDPTNYKPETYNALLEQRRNVLYNNLQDMGLTIPEIQQRSKQQPYVPYGNNSSESQKPVPTQSDIDYAKNNPNVRQKFIDKFGREP
jgi:hypothetical protein